ncbi:hypothetical protein ACQPZP_32775 [Spirillospora sp. CA-142024]|uniref:hypothetical protein n=1 Tax=Spirillospora sp. CA-142024 TaxID=3240036 RepID=UPI003D923F49
MADKAALAGSTGNVPDLATGEAGCGLPKLARCALVGLIIVAAAAVLASFVPRGHRGRRRLPRQHPWQRARVHVEAARAAAYRP